jgi:hypothetical protein
VRVAYEHEGDTQAGRQAFRQGGNVDHLFRGKRGNRWWRGIGKEPVGIVLDDAHIAALRDAGELLAPAFRNGDICKKRGPLFPANRGNQIGKSSSCMVFNWDILSQCMEIAFK